MTIFYVAAGIVVCILLSGFFSSAEMSYSSCNRIRLENAAEDGDRRSALAVAVTDRFDDALGAILIGNNLVNIASSSLGSVFLFLLLDTNDKAWISTVAITLLVIIFGETMPKIMAKKNANRYSRAYAPVIYGLMLVLKPLVWLTVSLVKLLTAGMKEEEPETAEEAVEELQSIIETAEDEAVLDEDRSELVQAAIDFPDISAHEVMTARVDIVALNVEDTPEEIMQLVEQSPYSRIPVYEESIDHVIGILPLNHYLKEKTESDTPDLRALLMPPCYVYKTVKLPAVLNQLRKAKQHLAVVTDEYGGTLGIITMEDVLEQIVGDIWDESDTVEEEAVERPDGTWELDGDMAIWEFLDLLDIPEEEFDGESDTLGGFVTESFGAYPKEGDSLPLFGRTVTVLKLDGMRVEKLLVTKDKDPAGESLNG